MEPGHPVLRVGCAMWANRDWVGRYFPAATPNAQLLRAYASWCPAVEGNTTFYSLPDAETVRRWDEQAPERFRFCFKLPRTVTHDRRLRDAEAETREFLERIAPVRDRCGPIMVQLPASFGPDGLEALSTFLARRDREFSWAVEVRNRAFFASGSHEAVFDGLLVEAGVDRVILDSRALFSRPAVTPAEVDAYGAKPRVPVRPVATGNQPVLRLIGHSDADHALEWWEPWFPKLASWLEEGKAPIVFCHTADNVIAPALARQLWGRVADLVPDLMPLPVPETDGVQLDLLSTDAEASDPGT